MMDWTSNPVGRMGIPSKPRIPSQHPIKSRCAGICLELQQRPEDGHRLEANLIYIVSYRPDRAG